MRTYLFILLLLVSSTIKSQTTFFNLDTVQKIELFFSQTNWDYQMDTAYAGADSYTLADSVRINGVTLDSVGVKYKGNSSYDSTYIKNPLHIALSKFKSHNYQGVKNIKLSNEYADPSIIREVLSYQILGNYMDCGKANFCQVYINGAYVGVYTNCQDLNSSFLSSHFYSNNGVYVKCNPIINPGPTSKCNLRYNPSVDSTGYFNYYEVKSNYGWNELVALCDTVTNYPASISSIMDMDRWLWMLSFDNILVNLDSYEGAFCQNYYLYKDHNNRFNPIIWDMNMSFGGFSFAGSGYTSLAQLPVTGMQQMPLNQHSTDVYWPVIKDVFNNSTFKKMYVAHARTITNEMFANGNYQTTAAHLQSIIDTAVQSDLHNFYTYSQFQNGMTGNVIVGSSTVPGISNLMNSRTTYLQSTTEFSYAPPTISNVSPSNASPAINASVTIAAHVSNTDTSSVFLGFRNSMSSKFTRIRMYDDGLHNDGVANDSIYGISFVMSSAQVQYYVYAENANAGMFSPERAEHEFYSLTGNVVASVPGQVFINEFVANNVSGATNESGAHSDWIEIYNNTSTPLSLFGTYLTDDFLIPQKFAIPDVTIIPANGFQILWADNSNSTSTFVHTNFSLDANGEHLMLTNGFGTVLDSISFGVQTADAAMARCPDGIGSFVQRSPTFNASNVCFAGIDESKLDDVIVYPNPTSTFINIQLSSRSSKGSLAISNLMGEVVLKSELNNRLTKLDVSGFSKGIYFVQITTNQNEKTNKKIIIE